MEPTEARDPTHQPLDPPTAGRLRRWATDWPELRIVAGLAGGPVHLVGGALRDLLLGTTPKDVDLVVPAASEALARQVARRTGAARVPLHDDPPTERLVLPGGRTLDLAAYRGPDLIADLRARDFTVNALALPLAALLDGDPVVVTDPTGGLADLQRGRIRLASPTALRDDPLRLLRAYRLAARTGWRIASATEQRIRRQRRGLRRPARERVASELLGILASPRAWSAVRGMTRSGVLVAALPALAGPLPSTWPALRRLGQARRDLPRLVGAERAAPLAALLAADLAGDRPRVGLLGWLALALAAAAVRRVPPDATVALVEAVADSLRCSRHELREASTIARLQAQGPLLGRPVGAGATRLVLAELGEAAPGALLLAWALEAGPAATDRLRRLLDCYWQVVAPRLAAPLLDGDTLMAALGLRPGPLVGELLAAVRAAHLAGEIGTPDEALALARRLRRDRA